MTAALDTEQIRDALRKVVDPEVGANIVDLGLVYRIELSGRQLLIEMTMTSPACPMGDLIVDDAMPNSTACCPPIVSVKSRSSGNRRGTRR
jgi:metal-sulfur cluster biosynthetic enzyme